jgi:hypothetical protein
MFEDVFLSFVSCKLLEFVSICFKVLLLSAGFSSSMIVSVKINLFQYERLKPPTLSRTDFITNRLLGVEFPILVGD